MSSIRCIFTTIVAILIAIQCWIFFNRIELKISFTPATEEEIYCANPIIENIKHLGGGLIEIDLNNDYEMIEKKLVVSAIDAKEQKIIRAQLRPGFNELGFLINKKIKYLNIMFTPQVAYNIANNSNERFDGVLGLYSSSICLTRPLKTVYEWTPGNLRKDYTEQDFNPEFINALRILEPLRGVPDKIMENAGIEEIANLVESAKGKVWCQQIALYTISKLRNRAPIRLVTSGGYLNGDSSVRTGGHDFVEYFDSKADRWVFSDPTNYILTIINNDGVPLNTLDLSRINSIEDASSMRGLSFKVVDLNSGKIETKQFSEMPDDVIRDLRFHIRDTNTYYYYTAESTWFKRGFIDKLSNQFSSRRQFSISRNGSKISIIDIRWVTQIILGFFVLMWGVYEYFAWWRKRG